MWDSIWQWNLEIKVYIDVFDIVCATRPSDTVAKYTIYLFILPVERLFKWSWGLFCCFILWLAKPGSKTPCILLCEKIFTRACFCKSSFFIPSFWHQDPNSYYLVVATVKIPKIWKRTSLGVYFSICKSQDRAINRHWIIQAKISIVHPTHFFNFVIVPTLLRNLQTQFGNPS